MHRVHSWGIAAALAVAFTAATFAQAPAQPAAGDVEFVRKAAEAGRKEVEQGKMAASKASNAQVKAYGQKLVKDHTAANQQLMAIAKRKTIDAGQAPAGADTRAAAGKERGSAEPWMAETGAAFDRGFIDAQVKAHEEAIALFEKQSTGGTDAELKGFAAKQLPGLRTHLKEAQDLQKKLGTSTH